MSCPPTPLSFLSSFWNLAIRFESSSGFCHQITPVAFFDHLHNWLNSVIIENKSFSVSKQDSDVSEDERKVPIELWTEKLDWYHWGRWHHFLSFFSFVPSNSKKHGQSTLLPFLNPSAFLSSVTSVFPIRSFLSIQDWFLTQSHTTTSFSSSFLLSLLSSSFRRPATRTLAWPKRPAHRVQCSEGCSLPDCSSCPLAEPTTWLTWPKTCRTSCRTSCRISCRTSCRTFCRTSLQTFSQPESRKKCHGECWFDVEYERQARVQRTYSETNRQTRQTDRQIGWRRNLAITKIGNFATKQV